MRVVLDTNTVLSALLFPSGRLAWLRHAWTQRHIVPLVSRSTSDELIRVLAYPKFKLSVEDIEVLLGAYLAYAEVVDTSSEGSLNLPVCRDTDDQMFLILAAVGNADVLVSGDQALLVLSGQTSFDIVTPMQFRANFFNG